MRETMPPKRHTRRSVLGAAGLGMAGLGVGAGLSGCASGARSTSPRTLRVWGGVPEETGPAAVIDAFEKRFPGHRVSYTRFINDDRGNLKLDTALQGGVDIDVYFTYDMAAMALRAGSGLALDLTDRVTSEPAMADFGDRAAGRAFWDGDRIAALATTQEPNVVLCNEDWLRQGRVEVPGRWTIGEFEAVVRRLAREGKYGAYQLPDLPRIAIGPDCWYADQGSNFGAPIFQEGLERSRRMIEDGAIFPWTEVLSRQLEAYQQGLFVQKDFALWLSAPFNLRYLNDLENYPHDFRVACAPVPTMEDGTGWNTGVYGNFVMINPNSARQDLAWEFVKFWILEGSEAMAPGGKIPALGNVDDDTMLLALLGPKAERFFDVDSFRRVLFEGRPKLFTDTEITAYPEIELALKQQQDLCLIGEKSPRRAVETVRAKADAAIARFGEDG